MEGRTCSYVASCILGYPTLHLFQLFITSRLVGTVCLHPHIVLFLGNESTYYIYLVLTGWIDASLVFLVFVVFIVNVFVAARDNAVYLVGLS